MVNTVTTSSNTVKVNANDMQQIDNEIEQLLTRWTLGNDAPFSLQDCPSLWQDTLAQQTQQDTQPLSLAALAMLSQYQALVQPAQAAQPLAILPDMPTLDYPILPERLQKYVRYILAEQAHCFYLLTVLLAQYGYSLPPELWLQYQSSSTQAKQQTPDFYRSVYGKWQYWNEQYQQHLAQANLGHVDADVADALSAETWADFAPAQRLLLLEDLRYSDADGCRELIAECIEQESADKRLKIIEILQNNLSENDVEFLQSLKQDRSKKVVQLANRLLQRLGYGQTDMADEELQELVAMLKVTPKSTIKDTLAKAIGKKRLPEYHIAPKNFKNSTQRERYIKLLEQFDIMTLAKALSLTVEQVIAGFSTKFDEHLVVFAKHLVNLPDSYTPAICQFIDNLKIDESAQWLNEQLWQRLPTEYQQQYLATAIKDATGDFHLLLILNYAQMPLSDDLLNWQQLQRCQFWKKQFHGDRHYFEHNCLQLGLILPTCVAQQALDDLAERTERMRIDPAFSSFLLNIELAKLTQTT
ncbi:DUF5691 domain-containing protein [Psychrobacter sp. I-STPA10]|uniref:DUF5691 domain-containing protein n=1 Tax=Psychrobacter sp. I-STPA10 TaxID=2585769 RepID=UPI001E644F05|nr:DUF5691 domain-containing protein [Psychrobacter sp. I-STPA10]